MHRYAQPHSARAIVAECAQDTYEGVYLIEVFVGTADRELKATFKADAAARVPRFAEVFKEALRPLCRR